MLRSVLAFVLAVACSQVALGQGLSKFKLPGEPKKSSTAESPFETRSREGDGPKLKMSSFRSVANSPYLIATIEHEDSQSFSKTKSGPHGVVNYVFFDTADDSAMTLLPNNDCLIISFDSYSESTVAREMTVTKSSVEQASVAARNADRMLWHVVEYVAADTDRDGELTTKDRHSLGIADASGQGFTEVVNNVGETYWKKIVDSDTLLLIHGSQQKQVAMRIDLARRKIISSKPLPNFGTR